MEDLDIVVTGLDPAQARSEIVSAIAKRLARSEVEIEDMLANVPAIVARASTEAEAQLIEIDLRTLGARVRYRDARPAPEDPPPAAAKGPLVYWSPDDEGYERPSIGEAVPPPPRAPSSVVPPLAVPAPTPIIVKSAAEWFGGARASAPPAAETAPPLDGRASAARFGRSDARARVGDDRPRVFFPAIGAAARLPFGAPLRLPMVASPVLGALTVALAALGLHGDERTGPLCVALAVAAAVGLMGLVHQIASSCAAASSSGDDRAAPMPGRLMQDYLIPGTFALAITSALGAGATYAAITLLAMRATLTLMTIFWSAVTIHAVLGLAITAAGRSPIGYLDFARIFRLIAHAPLETLSMVTIGGGLVGGAGFGVAQAFLLAITQPSASGLAIAALAIALPCAAIGTYGAALVGALTGLLLRAKPDAWRTE
jgi:hypothetical protein